MANHYLQFSEQIDDIPPDGIKWARKVLDFIAEDNDCTEAAEDVLKGLLYIEGNLGTDVEEWPDFKVDIDVNSIWFHSEEFDNIRNIGMFVQALIKRFMPDYIFSLTWAETCSKPRLGEFGGGCMVVSKDEIKSWNVYSQARQYVEELRKA